MNSNYDGETYINFKKDGFIKGVEIEVGSLYEDSKGNIVYSPSQRILDKLKIHFINSQLAIINRCKNADNVKVDYTGRLKFLEVRLCFNRTKHPTK